MAQVLVGLTCDKEGLLCRSKASGELVVIVRWTLGQEQKAATVPQRQGLWLWPQDSKVGFWLRQACWGDSAFMSL